MLVSSETGPTARDVHSKLVRFMVKDAHKGLHLPGIEMYCWNAKAEGITVDKNGNAVVVFDSDEDRKKIGSSYFHLKSNEDFYWIGKVDGQSEDPACENPLESSHGDK